LLFFDLIFLIFGRAMSYTVTEAAEAITTCAAFAVDTNCHGHLLDKHILRAQNFSKERS
jgi:hypothetical protein